MEKYYVIEQVDAIGNGHSAILIIVINPQIEGGGIHATKVGEFDWGNLEFEKVEPVDFMIIGNATCMECKNPFGE